MTDAQTIKGHISCQKLQTRTSTFQVTHAHVYVVADAYLIKLTQYLEPDSNDTTIVMTRKSMIAIMIMFRAC